MKVKPVNSAAMIRDPITKRALPTEGGDVPESNFWIRRLRAGEVVRIDQPAVAAPAAQPVVPTTPAAPIAPVAPVARVDQPAVAAPIAPLTTR